MPEADGVPGNAAVTRFETIQRAVGGGGYRRAMLG
jgi:hypothetical protein